MIEIKLKNLSTVWKGLRRRKIEYTTTIVLNTSIKELIAERQNEYNKLAFTDIGVGSTLDDFNRHFSQLHSYLVNKKTDEGLIEMSNVYQGYFNAINKISIWSYCWCAFIKSIDGVEYTKEGLPEHRKTIEDLSKKGLKGHDIRETLDEVKKNLIQNFDSSFLADIVTTETLTYYQNLKDKL